MRSPRIAPPVYGLVGSTVSTPTALFSRRNSWMKRSTDVLLPAPGEPVMPMIFDLPVWRNSCCNRVSASGRRFSTAVTARASARRSPERICWDQSDINGTRVQALAFQELPRYHHALDFAGSFADGAKFDVAIEFLH